MNIFDQYLIRIKKILLDLSKKGMIELPNELEGITAEIPPPKFNCDISTNVAMVLSKINKKLILLICINKYELFEKDDDLIKMWVKFPYFPYFLILYQIVGFLDFRTCFNDFFGVISRTSIQKNTKINMIIKYSTL